MKTRGLLFILLFASFIVWSQSRVYPPASLLSKGEPYIPEKEQLEDFSRFKAPVKQAGFYPEEEIGHTYYDLQTNFSISNRIVVYEDNTMGAVFNYGMDYNQFFPNRGTGYNYFDGSEWNEWPDTALESLRSGWPAYQPWGENGEINVAHVSGSGIDGLLINKRLQKGTGIWDEILFEKPPGTDQILFPHLATGGTDNQEIHLLSQVVGIIPFQGIMNPPVYSRSSDGGVTWDPENIVLNPIISSNYEEFMLDQFNMIAEEDYVAIQYGNPWIDLGLLKSTDGGDSWEQTIIWEHPYPNNNGYYPTDTFYCVDGAHHLAFDTENKVHVVFGITKIVAGNMPVITWFPTVDGIGYWNEDRPTFSNNLNALNPYDHPDSELVENYSLIGWTQDVDNNGTIELLDDWGEYYLGLSSMPQICIDDFDRITVIWSSVTETFDNGLQNYRHLWYRCSPNDGNWWGEFNDMNNYLIHSMYECVYPSVAEKANDAIHLVFQMDFEPGLAVKGDEDPYNEHIIVFGDIPFTVGIKEKENTSGIHVSPNHPNPFTTSTTFYITMGQPGDLTIEICNTLGSNIIREEYGFLPSGKHRLDINSTRLKSGIYSYVISSGNQSVTGKMIRK